MEEVEQVRRDMAGPEELAAALEQAKESGEFDGPRGEKGEKGDKGDAPIRGTDYWTAADKEAIVAEAANGAAKKAAANASG